MNKLVYWIRKYRSQIIGWGTYVYAEKYDEEDQDGMYVVVPVKLLAEYFETTMNTILYGNEEECIACKEIAFCQEEEICLKCGSAMNLWSGEE